MKQTRLDYWLEEPQRFDDGTWVLSRKIHTRKAVAFNEYKFELAEGYAMYDTNFTEEDIFEDFVKWQCHGDEHMYYLGAKEGEKGAYPAWTLHLKANPKNVNYI